jgi:iron complex outermembrane recepter protein
MRHITRLALAGVSLAALTTSAFAQDAPADDAAAADEIIVTGTLIRGIAPGGSQSIGVTQEKIQAIGAVNTSDLIANIPQAGNFVGFVGVRGSSNFSLAVNRPSLRYLGNTSASGSTTLLLMDGHRLPGMGITQSSPDLDAIAPSAIERVEIVTDGGSATYGSDAIGGVMNFVQRIDHRW